MEDIYEKVASRCNYFTERLAFFKSSPEIDVPTCKNCRYLKNNYCSKEVFDSIKENIERE